MTDNVIQFDEHPTRLDRMTKDLDRRLDRFGEQLAGMVAAAAADLAPPVTRNALYAEVMHRHGPPSDIDDNGFTLMCCQQQFAAAVDDHMRKQPSRKDGEQGVLGL
jgi:hypothetical protein